MDLAVELIFRRAAKSVVGVTRCISCLEHVCMLQLFATPWTVARQAPLSMGFQAGILEWVAMPSSRGPS